MGGEPKHYSSGHEEPAADRVLCSHCGFWVTRDECALPPSAHYEFAAVTGGLLCRFTTPNPEPERTAEKQEAE